MVMKHFQSGRRLYLCEECGFGYDDHTLAAACEQYCSTHQSCSMEITRRAALRPEDSRERKSDQG